MRIVFFKGLRGSGRNLNGLRIRSRDGGIFALQREDLPSCFNVEEGVLGTSASEVEGEIIETVRNLLQCSWVMRPLDIKHALACWRRHFPSGGADAVVLVEPLGLRRCHSAFYVESGCN